MKNKRLNVLFVGIIVFFIATGVAAATYLYQASEVSYNGDLTSNNVQDALDELYTKCEQSTTTCPSGVTCTAKNDIKCRRATNLHTETCENGTSSQYCMGAGYYYNDTIVYGNTSFIEGALTVGDAFDCDVDGDGNYTERFYYLSDYYDTSTLKFNDSVAVLVYYSDISGGQVSSSQVVPYATQTTATNLGYTCNTSFGCNWYGPITAINELPSTTDWSNISLYNNKRQILTNNVYNYTSGGTLPAEFDYSGYSARLLTYFEVYHNCNSSNITDSCNFLFEGTKFASSSNSIIALWLENPMNNNNYSIYTISMANRDTRTFKANGSDGVGLRPVIEIPKSQILY